ncbi:MAG: hypothetical protein NWF03_08565 [Candidatus Bathyarchaeota archaeon]|nr:hypothetical protein [Candidatus Bathyarchaeota archaeon]
MNLFDRILDEVPVGLELYTPVRRKPFRVERKEPERLVFLVKRTKIVVSKDCWNGIPDFLRSRGWVPIGAKHEVLENLSHGTLERYLREISVKDTRRESQGCYVVPLLEHLKIVEVRYNKRSEVKLIT